MNKEQKIIEKEQRIIGFVSTYEMYKIEESGVKPTTLRVLKFKVEQRLKKATHIRIRKGYTKECFTRRITNRTKWNNNWIISWNPNKALSLLQKEHEKEIEKLSKFETERIIKLKKEHEKETKKINDYFIMLLQNTNIKKDSRIKELKKEVDELKDKLNEDEELIKSIPVLRGKDAEKFLKDISKPPTKKHLKFLQECKDLYERTKPENPEVTKQKQQLKKCKAQLKEATICKACYKKVDNKWVER